MSGSPLKRSPKASSSGELQLSPSSLRERVEDGLLFGDVNDLCKGEVDIVLGMLEESAD